METVAKSDSMREKVFSFIWQHIMLVLSLFVMTFGVALCVRSDLGCSVISTIPFVMSQAGSNGMAPGLTIGEYTVIMNGMLVLLQILILRRKFEPVQLFQILIGFFFGYLLDVNMSLTALFDYSALLTKIVAQFAGCTILAVGISLEIRCGSVTMPGEGITVAISRVSGLPFPKAKIYVDSALVIAAVALCYVFFGHWLWNVVGLATLFAMFYVGFAVKIINPHMEWFSHMVCSRPGFKRYVYGLARFLRHNQDSSDS